jgi:hypothetical protein
MNVDVLAVDQRNVRGTDSNSLLRLYDLARGALSKSTCQQERVKAERAIQRIAKELQKRNVTM